MGAAMLIAGTAVPAAAQQPRAATLFVQGGSGEDGLGVASIGVQWPWAWRSVAWGGELSASTELFGSAWRAEVRRGRDSLYQLGLVPTLRYRFSEGRSPWFVEGGIGISVTDKLFVTRRKVFGSTWNFSDTLALGRSFGDEGRHELSLRLQHTSNAGIKKPNPGLNIVMLRYAAAF